MTHPTDINTDILIIGGGVTGLWLCKQLHSMGFSVLLLENNELGGEQTMLSQGIIHGGLKYALSGRLNKASESISGMPQRWKRHLSGEDEFVNLSSTKVLSDSQYLWSPAGLMSSFVNFLARKSLKSRVKLIRPEEHPHALIDGNFKGKVYQLNEVVLDIPSLIGSLSENLSDYMMKVDTVNLQTDVAGGRIKVVQCRSGNYPSRIRAQRYILAAGAGNEALLKNWGCRKIAMQRRPLHMVMVKHSYPHPLYAHCLSMSKVPRITVSSHATDDGQWVWYLGGAIAENGVHCDKEHQISQAQREMKKLLPWVDLTHARWSTKLIDRAEPTVFKNMRPSNSFCYATHNAFVVWPTKLTLTPQLADVVLHHLNKQKVTPSAGNHKFPDSLPRPKISNPFWSKAFA